MQQLLIERRADEMKQNVIAAALGLSLIGVSVDAQNTRNCAPRELVVDRLASGYGETRQPSQCKEWDDEKTQLPLHERGLYSWPCHNPVPQY